MNPKADFLRKLTVCPIWDQRIILDIVSVAVVFQTIKILTLLLHLTNKCAILPWGCLSSIISIF